MTQRDDRRAGFGADGRGAIAVMTALLLPVLIGIAAYAIDASLLLYRQERLQIAADIGARAGAEMLVRGESDARAEAFAEAMVLSNSGANDGAALTVEAKVSDPAKVPRQVSVEASLPVPRIFSQLFGSGDVIVRAGSVEVYEIAEEPAVCVYLDDQDAKPGLRLRNKSILSLVGCEIAVVSDDNKNAVRLDGRATLRAPCINVAGGISGSDGIITTTCEAPNTDVEIPEPADFASVPIAPRREVGCEDWESEDEGEEKKGGEKGKGGDGDDGTKSACPVPGSPVVNGLGQICLKKMTVEHDTECEPGIYFIEKELKIEDGSTLTLKPGSVGSVIVLLDKAKIDMDDDATLIITAPESGALAGMAIMQGRDRKAPDDREHEMGRIEIEGWIVLPEEAIEITGQSTEAPCTRIRSGTLELGNDAVLEISCPKTSR